MMDGADAWADVINVWKTYDRVKGDLPFVESISDTIHGPESANCGILRDTSNCDETLVCNGFYGGGSGAAGYEIWNSFVIIHRVCITPLSSSQVFPCLAGKLTGDEQPLQMYLDYYNALYRAAGVSINPELKNFENKFAPVPPALDDPKWLQILLGLISLGATMIAAPFFNSCERPLHFLFIKHS
jgi:hypothetical protein